MKRLIVCADGTWQSLSTETPTNVRRTAQLIAPQDAEGAPQIVYYGPGVGTAGLTDQILGGAFGRGLDYDVCEAYRFLALNYQIGDEIFLFGFSRGAYTARSLAGMIAKAGLVRRGCLSAIPEALALYRDPDADDAAACAFRRSTGVGALPPLIRFLGCWDTVGALGVPDIIPFLPFNDFSTARYEFLDARITPYVQTARHALALEERRDAFAPTPMLAPTERTTGDILELWFAGDHGAVGGGDRRHRGLSDCALGWMLDEAGQAGLTVDPDLRRALLKPDAFAPFEPRLGLASRLGGLSPRRGPQTRAQLSPWTIARFRALGPDYHPESLDESFLGPL